MRIEDNRNVYHLQIYKQVAPAELEQLLVHNPKIQDAGVIGIPDNDAGEVPLAFIVKQPKVNLTEDEVRQYVAGKLIILIVQYMSKIELR